MFSAPFEEQTTVVRSRGFISIRPEAENADLEVTGAFGIGVVSAEAFTAGVASIPEPFSDGDWGGWLVWQPFGFNFEFQSGIGLHFPDWRFEVDSKAMRRLSPSEALVCVAESQSGAFKVQFPARVLVKLS